MRESTRAERRHELERLKHNRSLRVPEYIRNDVYVGRMANTAKQCSCWLCSKEPSIKERSFYNKKLLEQ